MFAGFSTSRRSWLARPFSVGQHVIVRHPNTELCDSKVILMEADCYKVQFDKPDLGVDIVKVCICYFGSFQQLSVYLFHFVGNEAFRNQACHLSMWQKSSAISFSLLRRKNKVF